MKTSNLKVMMGENPETRPLVIMDRKEEKDLITNTFFSVAKDYCDKNGLFANKLQTQKFFIISSSAIFAQPSDVEPGDGLMNDIATQPKPTLVIKDVNGEIVVEQTEHTQKYLSV